MLAEMCLADRVNWQLDWAWPAGRCRRRTCCCSAWSAISPTWNVTGFRRVLDDQDIPWLYGRDDDRDAAFNAAVVGPALVAAAWAAWREEVRLAERFVDAAPDLELTSTYEQGVISLREVLVHMIEKHARHADHADLLRECVDGRAGQ